MKGAAFSVALHAVAIAGLVVADEVPTPAPETIEITVALVPPEPARQPTAKPVAVERTAQPASPPPAPRPAAQAPVRKGHSPAPAPRPSPAPKPAADVTAPVATATATAAAQSSAAASLGVGEAAPAVETAALPTTGPTRDAQYQLGAADTPLPDYPWSARRRNREGRVVVRLTVAADGSVQSAEVLESSGDAALDGAARDTLGKWRLHPALHNGAPVASQIDVPIRFELRQQAGM